MVRSARRSISSTELIYGNCRIPDLELPAYHPKRAFIRRVIDLETRLAYHDRIVKTLPEDFVAAGANCVPESAPGPDFEYEDPRKCVTVFA